MTKPIGQLARRIVLAAVPLSLALAGAIALAQQPARWSVPVRIFAVEAPPQTASSTLLPPQYQTSTRSRSEEPPSEITVDGKPFRLWREERIGLLLSGPAQSEGEDPFAARLRRYADATKRPPSRDEVRWWLAHWADGPNLLWLDENYQRVRATESPLFAVLDRDEDGLLSAAEIELAQESLWKYDANQDEVLSLAEIAKAAERTPSEAGPPVIPPLIPAEQIANSPAFQRLDESYRAALPRSPQLLIDVAFDTRDPSRSRLEVSGSTQPIVGASALTLLVGGTWLEFSAVQAGSGAATDQVSLGAVRDGYPLLPDVDVNEDGRLTVREVRQVSKRLAAFDRNQDGVLSKAELLPTLRVAFGLGPTVHRQLATVRSIHPPVAAASVAPPEWFTRMDRNKDGDLTPREFLGGKEQFDSLDADDDGLISSTEASEARQMPVRNK
jgi:Ca2+-binding EF-hand superfamily protein